MGTAVSLIEKHGDGHAKRGGKLPQLDVRHFAFAALNPLHHPRLIRQPTTAARPAKSSCVRFCWVRSLATVWEMELRSVRWLPDRPFLGFGMGDLSPVSLP